MTSALEWIGLTLAFLPPVPPERPDAPPPPGGGAWVAALVMGSIVVTMVLPMIMIWSFHRPNEAVRARCEAAGGHLRYTSLSGSRPYRCDDDRPAAP